MLGIVRKVRENTSADGRSNGCSSLAQRDFRCSMDEHLMSARRAVNDALERRPKRGKVHDE